MNLQVSSCNRLYIVTIVISDEKTLENDIAMVKLSSKVTLSANSYINNICINDDKSADGTECVAAGWGTERKSKFFCYFCF